MFRNLGFNAIEDRASNSKKAAVNAWEPEQIVILDRDAFEIVGNKEVLLYDMRKQIDELNKQIEELNKKILEPQSKGE